MALNRALIFLGPPGAGKGTQAKRIAHHRKVPHLSTGDMFRDAVTRGTGLGKLAKPIMERGGLVPDEIVMGMVEERLAQPDCASGFVFDGFPRTIPQAEQLDAILKRLGFGKPLVIDGLWTLTLGGGRTSSSDTLYFTAGPNGETDGLFGTITPVSGKFDNDD